MPALTRTIYFKNSAGCVWEEPENYLRLEYYPGAREEAQFRALLTHVRQALQRHGWHSLLINQQQMSPFMPAEETWIVNEWLPQTVREAGYRHGVVIVARDVFARLAMSNLVMTSRGLGHTYRNFEHEKEAIDWLISVG
ncbi:hypothetical protein A0257_09165 [Hymenobacter psoromatis]|nr:hypothetical protein A0257_09165 [Hymenobacter psoromatis]